MKPTYAVLGAGRQGTASAYDLALFGEPDRIIIADSNFQAAEAASKRVNELIGRSSTHPIHLDVENAKAIVSSLQGVTSIISAVPYKFNLDITKAAIELGANMCDLGGHTQTVLKQRELNETARKKGISIVPDCGMGPGMNISMAVFAMSLLDEPREVYIWDGGLPQDPKPPWNYALTFNIQGLTNEYSGSAYFLREGKITEVPCFQGYEELSFQPPLNRLEAFVTSGGLSTMPWTFEGKLNRLENKTLRYPGHHAQFSAFSDLGLLEEEQVAVGNANVAPRDLLHRLLEPKLAKANIRDIAVIRVKCVGKKGKGKEEAVVELVDMYDEKTGFTAMQRLTGWHASIVAILCAQNKIQSGVVPVEALSGDLIVGEIKRRGIKIKVDLL